MMEFAEWEPAYAAILADFGYDRGADRRARNRLDDLLAPSAGTSSRLDFDGRTVAICGAGPNLEAELGRVERAERVVAASDAARRLLEVGSEPDCMVTDLDKTPGTARDLTRRGTTVAVHAHGDNIPAIESYVPRLSQDAVIPTTQARPAGQVRNFGGFTDGDRAAFLADALGADRLVFAGWSLDDEEVGPEKRRKLRWAGRLLCWLERRRTEQFALLDGWRDRLDTSMLP